MTLTRYAGIFSVLVGFGFFLNFAAQHRLPNQEVPRHMTSEELDTLLGGRTIYTDLRDTAKSILPKGTPWISKQ